VVKESKPLKQKLKKTKLKTKSKWN